MAKKILGLITPENAIKAITILFLGYVAMLIILTLGAFAAKVAEVAVGGAW